MQGQPASEAPASNLQELLKEIKELKEGLLVDSVTHDNPTFEGPPWRNQRMMQSSGGMRLDIPNEDLDDSLEDLVARDSGLQFILSPQAEAQVVRGGQRFEQDSTSPQRTSAGASGIGRMYGSGLSPPGVSTAVYGTPPTPAADLAPTPPSGAQPSMRCAVPSAIGSAHMTPLTSGATVAPVLGTPVGPQDNATGVATPASGASSTAGQGKLSGVTPPTVAAPRSKFGSRIARPGVATAPAGSTASRTPSASSTTPPMSSPTSRTGSTTQHHITTPTATTSAGTGAGAAISHHAPFAPPKASVSTTSTAQGVSLVSTPAQPRTTRQKVAAAVSAIGAIASSGRRTAGRNVPVSASTPSGSTFPGARSSSGSGGSSSGAVAAAAATAVGASARKRPPQGAPEAPAGTPARKVTGSAGPAGGAAGKLSTHGPVSTHSTASIGSALKHGRAGLPAAPVTASKAPGRSSHSASASAHSGSTVASPPMSPPQTRRAVATTPAAATATVAAAVHSHGQAVTAAAAATEFQCEVSQPSLTLPTSALTGDALADESLEDMLADDPLLEASAQAEAPVAHAGINAASAAVLQRRTSDELLRQLADAMAGGQGTNDWMNEDADAEMSLLMQDTGCFGNGGSSTAAPVAVGGGLVATASAAAGAPVPPSEPQGVFPATPSPQVHGGLLQSTANEILAAASLRASLEPSASTVCKVRELLGLDGQQESPELNSEELWRNIEADANNIFSEHGGGGPNQDKAGALAPVTTTTAAVAAAVAMSRDPSMPSSPAGALQHVAAIGGAVAQAAAQVPTASPLVAGLLGDDDRRSLNAAELAAVAGAMQCEILDTDDGFLGDLLAAEAVEAAAVVVAAGSAVPMDDAPVVGVEDENPPGSRRLLHQSSSASSFGFDAAVAFEAAMISRQLAGGPLAVRPNINTDEPIMEADEVASAAATPSVASAPVMVAVKGLPPSVADEAPQAILDLVMEDGDQDEPAMPAATVANGDSSEHAHDDMEVGAAEEPVSLPDADVDPAAILVQGLAVVTAPAAVLGAERSQEDMAVDAITGGGPRTELAQASAAADALLAAEEALAAAAVTSLEPLVASGNLDAAADGAGDRDEADAVAGLLSLAAGATARGTAQESAEELGSAGVDPAADDLHVIGELRAIEDAAESPSVATVLAGPEPTDVAGMSEGASEVEVEGSPGVAVAGGLAASVAFTAAAGARPVGDVDMVAWGSDVPEISAGETFTAREDSHDVAAAAALARGMGPSMAQAASVELQEGAALDGDVDLLKGIESSVSNPTALAPEVQRSMDVDMTEGGGEVKEAVEEAVPEDAQLALAAAVAASAISAKLSSEVVEAELPETLIDGSGSTQAAAASTPRLAAAPEGALENVDMLAESSWATVSATEVFFEADASASADAADAPQAEASVPMDDHGKATEDEEEPGEEPIPLGVAPAAAAPALGIAELSRGEQRVAQYISDEVTNAALDAFPVAADARVEPQQALLMPTDEILGEASGSVDMLGVAVASASAAVTFTGADEQPQAQEAELASSADIAQVESLGGAQLQAAVGMTVLATAAAVAAAEEPHEDMDMVVPDGAAADVAGATVSEDMQPPIDAGVGVAVAASIAAAGEPDSRQSEHMEDAEPAVAMAATLDEVLVDTRQVANTAAATGSAAAVEELQQGIESLLDDALVNPVAGVDAGTMCHAAEVCGVAEVFGDAVRADESESANDAQAQWGSDGSAQMPHAETGYGAATEAGSVAVDGIRLEGTAAFSAAEYGLSQDVSSPVERSAIIPVVASVARQPLASEDEPFQDAGASSPAQSVVDKPPHVMHLDGGPLAPNSAAAADRAVATSTLVAAQSEASTGDVPLEAYADAVAGHEGVADAEMRRASEEGLDEQMFDAEEDGFEVAQATACEPPAVLAKPAPEPEPLPVQLGEGSTAMADEIAPTSDPEGPAITAFIVDDGKAATDEEMEAPTEGNQQAAASETRVTVSPRTDAFTHQAQGPFASPPLETSGRLDLPTVHSHQLDDADYDVDDDDEDANEDDSDDGVPDDLPHKAPAGAGAALLAAAAASAPATSGAKQASEGNDPAMAEKMDTLTAAASSVATARKRARLASPGPIAEGVESGSTVRESGTGSGASGGSTPPGIEAEVKALPPMSGMVMAERADVHVHEPVPPTDEAPVASQAESTALTGVADMETESAEQGGVHASAELQKSSAADTTKDAGADVDREGLECCDAEAAAATAVAAPAAALAADVEDDAQAGASAGELHEEARLRNAPDDCTIVSATEAVEAEVAPAAAAALHQSSGPELAADSEAAATPSAAQALRAPAVAALALGMPDEVAAQAPAAVSPRMVSVPESPSPKPVDCSPAAGAGEQLLHAWQVLVPPVSSGAHDSESEGAPTSRGSLAAKRSLRSMLSGGSRLSRVSSRRDEDAAEVTNADAVGADDCSTHPAVQDGTVPAAFAVGATLAVSTAAPTTGQAGIPMEVDAPAPTSPAQVTDRSFTPAATAATCTAPLGMPTVGGGDEDEQLVPAWKAAAAANVAGADKATTSNSSDFSVSAARLSLGVRRSLRSLPVSPGGSRLKRSTSQASISVASPSADAAADAPSNEVQAAAVDAASAEVPPEVPGPVLGVVPLGAINTATSRTAEVAAVGTAETSAPVSPCADVGVESLAPAWKVMALPSPSEDSPDAVAAARGVPLGSQPSFRSCKAGGSRLRRASEPTIGDFHFVDTVGRKGAGMADTVADGGGHHSEDGADPDSAPEAAVQPEESGMVETGAVLFLGSSRSRSILGSDAANAATAGRASRLSTSGSESADGRAPQVLLRHGSLGRVGGLARSTSSFRRDSALEPGSGPFRAGVSESGGATSWMARVSSRRLQTEPVGSVPILRCSAGGGDPNVDALRPAWQVLPLPMSPESPVDTGNFGGSSPGAAPTAPNMLASMRSSSRLSRMSSGIPEDLLAELRMQAQAAVGHLQGSPHGNDSGGGLADMNSSMDESGVHAHLPLGVSSGSHGEPLTPVSGDGAGGTMHAWKVLPLRQPTPTMTGLSTMEAQSGQAGSSSGGAGALPPPLPATRTLGGRPTLAGTRAGNQSSRLAVASTNVPALQVSFETTSPSTCSPRGPSVPAVGEEGDENDDEETVVCASAARPPLPPPSICSADTEGGEMVHAWKLVPPSPSGSVSGSAAAASAPVGTGAATAALTTSQEGSNCADPAPAAAPAHTRPQCALGTRPSLKSITSVGGSRLSRISLAVEDYVDDSYSEAPASTAVEDDGGDAGGGAAVVDGPEGHSADCIAPADAVNQSAVAAAAAAAAAAIAAADAEEAGDPQSERSSAPAAVGGLPSDVLYAAGARGSRPGSGHLDLPGRRSDDGAMPDGPIAFALNSRPSIRSSRSSSSSRLSRASSLRDGASGAAPLDGIREEDGEGVTPSQSTGGAPAGGEAASDAAPGTLPDSVMDEPGEVRATAVHEQQPNGHQNQINADALPALAGDEAGAVGSSASTPDSSGSKQVAAAAALAGTPHRMGRSGSLGSSRLSRVTSQASDAGLEDIVEEAAEAAAGTATENASDARAALEDSSREPSAAAYHDRVSAGRAPPRAPSAGTARIGSPGGSLRVAAAPPIPEVSNEDAEEGPLLPAWKVLLPAADTHEAETAGERTSPSPPPGSTRQPAMRVQRSSSLGNSRLRRVTSGLDEHQAPEPEDAAATTEASASAVAGAEAAASTGLDGTELNVGGSPQGSSDGGDAAAGAVAAAASVAELGTVREVVPPSQMQTVQVLETVTTTRDDNLTLANLPSARFDGGSSLSNAAAAGRVGSGGFSSFSVPQPPPSGAPSPVPAAGAGAPPDPAAAREQVPQAQLQPLQAGAGVPEVEVTPVEAPAARPQGVATGEPAPLEKREKPPAPPKSAKKSRGLFSCMSCFGGSTVSE